MDGVLLRQFLVRPLAQAMAQSLALELLVLNVQSEQENRQLLSPPIQERMGTYTERIGT